MASVLIFLSLWACSYAQLIYPDEFEQMRTSFAPQYFSANVGRQSKVQSNSFRQPYPTIQSFPVTQQQSIPQLGAALAGPPIQQAVPSSLPSGFTENPLRDWNNHVNDIIVKGVMKFSLDVEREIYKSKAGSPVQRENVIFSPLSLAMTLAMVLLGSAGRTFDEVSRVLGLQTGIDISTHSEIVHQIFGLLLGGVHDRIVGSPGPRVDFASAIFVQDGYSIRPEFKAISENVYNSEVLKLDFFGHGKEAQDVINDWVLQKTLGKIKSILSDVPRPETNVILISALYFNGEWNQHFLTGATKRRPFSIEPDEVINVDMMYNGGMFPFYEDKQLGVKILGLPYKGFEISMYILLPTAKGATALRNFQSRLTVDIVENLINNMKNETCIIGLPRMKLSSTLSLKSTLKGLGLTSLFDPATADLSLLSQGYTGEMMSPVKPSVPPVRLDTVPTVSPLPASFDRPGKTNVEPTKLTDNNDLFIFPRFGEDEQGDMRRRNFFSYEDKIRGLTVQQWSTGFSIGRTQRARRSSEIDKKISEQSRTKVAENANSYAVNESNASSDNTKIVNLEQNKYRFENTEKAAVVTRRKRKSRPVNQDFLNYLQSQNFPSYGLDNLRNSANLINPSLYAGDVLHKVEIDITETGTEAAAVTAVLIERDGNQKRLIANRPFLFFIRHNPSKLVLFWGTLNTPTPNYSAT